MTCSRQPSAATAKRKSAPVKRASPRKTRKGKKALEEEAAAAEALSNADGSDDGIASEAPSTDIPGRKRGSAYTASCLWGTSLEELTDSVSAFWAQLSVHIYHMTFCKLSKNRA